jgi:1-acyl-sn-glycerol-3-phosphate acyltransferase
MNHQSALDLLSNAEIYPTNCIVIVKRALTKVPFFGWIVALGDNIFLERENRSKSIQQMAIARDKIQKKGLSVWIFPEGTRRNTGAIHPFKRGAFHLAIQAQVPIVPVVVSSYHGLVDLGRWKAGHILVEVLPPQPTVGLNADDVDALIARCHQAMAATFAKNTQELMATKPAAT